MRGSGGDSPLPQSTGCGRQTIALTATHNKFLQVKDARKDTVPEQKRHEHAQGVENV